MNKFDLTVMFATRNGGATLRQTLEGYCRLEAVSKWRMVVIDNGSTDDTLTILNEYQTRLPLMVYVEEQPGKNAALNTGLRGEDEAGVSAELYVFTDDDAVPTAGYLQGWLQVISERANYDIFGGVVLPEFMESPPEWLRHCENRFGELYAKNDRPEGPIEATHVFGPNMAVRGWLIAKGCRFDESIGPNGSSTYPMGSETEFCVRIEREHDLRAWFTQMAKVQHLVRPWQMTEEFFAGRATRHGRGVASQQIKSSRAEGLARMMLIAAISRCIHPLEMHLAVGMRRQEAIWKYNWWRGYLTERVEMLRPTALEKSFFERRALAVELALRACLRLPVVPRKRL